MAVAESLLLRLRWPPRLVAGLVAGLVSAVAGAEPLRVGLDQAFPPHQFLDASGAPTGFDVELFAAVAEVAGLDHRLVSAPWFEIRGALESGELDVGLGVVRTEEREALLDFTAPIAVVEHALFVRADSPVRQREELRGAAIIVERGAVWEDLVRERGYPVELLGVPGPPEALRRLAGGEADAAILLRNQALYLMRSLGIDGLRSVGIVPEPLRLRFAVPQGRDALLLALNDGLAEVHANGVYDRLWDRWFGVLQERPVWREPWVQALAAAGATLLLGLGASLLWSRSLRSRVEARTRELVASQEQNRELESRLHQAQKMEALGRLAGGVAHDFNNVLTVILSGLHVARDGSKDRPKLQRAIDSALGAARAATDLVRQLLDFSRRRESAPRRVCWNRLIEEHREMLRRLLGSMMRLEVALAPDLSDVRMDPAQATQILLNLAVNARDACQGRGHLSIETHDVERAGAAFVRLTVRDDGPGMDEATRERIFEPFFTTKGDEGTGLGLATVYAIATQQGGAVEVESAPDRGSSFHVDLPAMG